MISYNRSIVNKMLSSFSNIIRTNICVYDDNFEFQNIQNEYNKSCCYYINPAIQPKCSHSDCSALKKANELNTPFHYSCHFGFTEIMIPYTLNSKEKIYVLIGPFRNKETDAEMMNRIKDYCSLLKIDSSEAINKYLETPYFSEQSYKSIVDMIDVVIDYSQKNKFISIKENFISDELDPYLEENISKNMLNSEIATHFYFTNKQLEYIVKKQTGMTPKKYILSYKMDVAKKMLVSTDKPLQAIAVCVGFDDYNYFIKVFKSFSQMTPSKYRDKFQSN